MKYKKCSNHKLLETNEIECIKGSSPIYLALPREMKLFLWNVNPGAEDAASLELQKPRETVGVIPSTTANKSAGVHLQSQNLGGGRRIRTQNSSSSLASYFEAKWRYMKAFSQKIF